MNQQSTHETDGYTDRFWTWYTSCRFLRRQKKVTTTTKIAHCAYTVNRKPYIQCFDFVYNKLANDRLTIETLVIDFIFMNWKNGILNVHKNVVTLRPALELVFFFFLAPLSLQPCDRAMNWPTHWTTDKKFSRAWMRWNEPSFKFIIDDYYFYVMWAPANISKTLWLFWFVSIKKNQQSLLVPLRFGFGQTTFITTLRISGFAVLVLVCPLQQVLVVTHFSCSCSFYAYCVYHMRWDGIINTFSFVFNRCPLPVKHIDDYWSTMIIQLKRRKEVFEMLNQNGSRAKHSIVTVDKWLSFRFKFIWFHAPHIP